MSVQQRIGPQVVLTIGHSLRAVGSRGSGRVVCADGQHQHVGLQLVHLLNGVFGGVDHLAAVVAFEYGAKPFAQ
jgi:hypothetical protein